MNSLLDVDPGNAQVTSYGKTYFYEVKNRTIFKYAGTCIFISCFRQTGKDSAKSNVTAEIKSNGKTIGKIDGNDWKAGKETLRSDNIEIITKGNGRLYYSWQVEGIRASGVIKKKIILLK